MPSWQPLSPEPPKLNYQESQAQPFTAELTELVACTALNGIRTSSFQSEPQICLLQ